MIKIYNNNKREKLCTVVYNLYKEIIESEGKAKFVGVPHNQVSNECTRIQCHAFRRKKFRVQFEDGEHVTAIGLNNFIERFVTKVQDGGRIKGDNEEVMHYLSRSFPWMHAFERRKVVFEVDVYVFDLEKGLPEDKVEEEEEEEVVEIEAEAPTEIENNPKVVEEVVETTEAPEVIEEAAEAPTKKPRLRRTKA